MLEYLPANLGMLSPILAGMLLSKGDFVYMDNLKKFNQCNKSTLCSKCSCNTNCNDWCKFLKLHNEVKIYAHFDKRVSLQMPTIIRYVMNPQKVASHSFFPFIHFTKTISRYGRKEPKKRELYYCSHLDRCVFQRYAFLINQEYNKRVDSLGISNVAVAYRDNLGKNNIDFAKYAFDSIKKMGKCFIIVGDFKNFFDNLNHKYLKQQLCSLLNIEKLPADYYAVYKNITKFSSCDWKLLIEKSGNNVKERGLRKKINQKDTILSKEEFKQLKLDKTNIIKNPNSFGIPQGSPISAALSNVYMLEFDKKVNDSVLACNGKYMRYSDDFIIVLPYEDKEEANLWIKKIKSNVDKIEGLDLQKEKTQVYIYDNNAIINFEKNIEDNIDYLGFVFDGVNIKIRPKSITKYYYRMHRKAKNIVRCNWMTKTGRRISAKKLYDTYASNEKKNQQTFIDYAKRAKGALSLNDSEADALINNYKHKIANALKVKSNQ